MADPLPQIKWLLTQGRFMSLQDMVETLGPALRSAGMSLMRIRLAMRANHPLIAASSLVWELHGAEEREVILQHGEISDASYQGSPIQAIYQGEHPYRRDLRDPFPPGTNGALLAVQALGGTDYYGIKLPYAKGGFAIALFASDAPDRFTDDEIACLNAVAAALAPIVEAHQNQNLATAIATSYLGSRTGQRVLDGEIQRGNIDTIEAAILFSDIRGWTALNASATPENVLDVANSYFDVVSEAIAGQNGEILKFMGDGVLALFPTDGTDAGRQTACRQALASAQAAQRQASETGLAVPFGIGMHFGRVQYGNVGARDRLDFTVMGQAVNIAARVEACCGRLGQPILASASLADIAAQEMTHISTENLKGVTDPMSLFAPGDNAPATN